MALLSTAYKCDSDGSLLPVAKGLTQTTLDGFVVRYHDQVKVAQVRFSATACLYVCVTLCACVCSGEEHAAAQGHPRPAAQQVLRP